MSVDSKQRPRRPQEFEDDFGVVTEPGALRLERVLPGPIERVWAYLTEPEKRAKWLAPGPMELRPGGRVELKFRLADLSADTTLPKDKDDCEVDGRITRCEPPRVLSFTWNDGAGDLSEVTFELNARAGEVLLVLTHRRIGGRAHLIGVASGWHTHIGILMDRLSGREPRPFWRTKVQMEAEYEKRIAT
jgi:uncharacterized protein YndB with AHSA1/START domain